MKRLLILILSAAFLSGCVTSTVWTYSEGKKTHRNYLFGMTFNNPENWYQKQIQTMVLFSKHGLSLEYIMFDQRAWKDSLSNGYCLSKKILLQELQEVILGDLCSSQYAFNMTIDTNKIILLDSLPVAFTTFRYVSTNSLKMKGVQYCIPLKKTITVLRYTAEESHYFQKTYADFLKMIPSIKIKKRKYLALPGISVSSK